MSEKTSKILAYLNTSLNRTDLKAALSLGLKMNAGPSGNDGIYFYRKTASPLEALSAEELNSLIKLHEQIMDPRAVNVIVEFSQENTSLINKGAGYIPLENANRLRIF